MKTKMTVLLFALSMGATSSFAQTISAEDRFGHGEDSIKCLTNISVYSEYVKTKNYADAYEPWREVFDNCPAARNDTYENGILILQWKIKNEEDATNRATLVDELMSIYDQRLVHLEVLNSLLKNPVSKSNILSRKAHDYIMYTKPIDLDKAHKMLSETLNMDPEGAQYFLLLDLMQISSLKCKKEEAHKPQMVKDYLQTSDIANKNLNEANKNAEKDGPNQETYQKIAKMWDDTKNNLNAYFINSGAADCESLQAIYAPQIEENKDNLDFLKQVITIMRTLKCTDQDVYMTASEYVHNIAPTSESAAGCANRYFKKGDYTKAIEFLEQAAELETEDNIKKAEFTYKVAAILSANKQLSKAKSYANKAISLNPNYGHPYILIAQMYASSPNWSDESAMNKCTYFAAIDKLQRAKSVDPSIAEEANKLINTYAAYTPKAEDLFFLGLKKGDSVTIGGWIGETTTIR